MASPQAHVRKDLRSSAERASVDSLYFEHSTPLHLWLSGRLPPSYVDDVSQEVWTRIAAYHRSHFDGGNFRAWMFEIARNCVTDFIRKKKKELPSLDEDGMPHIDDRAEDPGSIAIRRERRRCLAECIATLGQPRRAIIEARLAGGTYDEFAPELKLTTQQAHSHFFAAKKLLLACMKTKYSEAV